MINSVCLVGYLGMDPEIRSTPSGTKVAKMRLAVREYRFNRQTNEKTIKTHWFSLNAWDRLADTCERFLKKGTRIAVRGSLEYQEWTKKEGGRSSKIEVRIREMEILTPLSDQRGVPGSGSHDTHPDTAVQPHADNAPDEIYAGDDFAPIQDDDIPF